RIDGQPVQDPQGPAGLPVVGSFYEIFPDHLGNHYRFFRKYGPVIKTTNMGKTTYLTDSPDVAQVALAESAYFTKKINASHPLWGVKDNTANFIGDTENENWRLAHKFLPPAMGPKAVKHYTPLMQECARKSFEVFDELDSRGEAWNVYQFMVKLASQTIGKFALGMDFGHFKSVDAPLHPLVTDIVNLLSLNKKVTTRGEWTPEFAHGLPYLDKFVKEAKRLHNASFQPGRTTKTDVVLPGGYRLPQDAVIIPALYAIHTNPAVWRDPFRFDQDRWDTEEVKNRHRCAYIPFATGPRGCIGFNFALLEVKILLSDLIYRYEFTREGVEAVEYDPEFQLIRPLNLYCTAKRRTQWAFQVRSVVRSQAVMQSRWS
ncbi:cytochrome P450 monooxygenase, partial [Coniochaeta sp. 2T2.1]